MACPMILVLDQLLPSFTTVALSCISLTVLFSWIRYRRQKYAFFRRIGIPGPSPSMLDGNYKELMRERKPWLVIDVWIQKYGKVFGYFQSGPFPHLIVADHEMLKEILIKKFSHFTDRTQINNISKDRLPKIFRGNLTVSSGQDWKRVRSTLTPIFSAKKMKMMSSKMNTIVNVLLGILDRKSASKEIVDIYGLFQGLTLDVIGKCAFAMDVDCQRNPDDPFLHTVRALFRNANSPFLRLLKTFPEIGFLTAPMARFAAANFRRGRFLAENLDKEIQRRKHSESTVKDTDLIQLMLEADEDGKAELHKGTDPQQSVGNSGSFLDVRKKYLTEEEIISNAFVFLLAGFETTANCLGFTAYLLAKNPKCQERLYEEINRVIGSNIPDYDSVHRLPYLEMVIAESLRLFPPVTSFVTRMASDTVKVGDYTILAGTGVEVPIWHLHHDPNVWENPYAFDPERFSAENKPSIPQMAYLPFGDGPRNCIGMRFAQLEIKIAMVRILQKFQIIQCEKSEPEMQLFNGNATINPKNGVFVRIVKR